MALPVWTLQLHSFPRQHPISRNLLEFRMEVVVLGFRVVNPPDYYGGKWAPMRVRTANNRHRKLVLRAFSDPEAGGDARKHKQHQQDALAAARDAANLMRLKETQNPIDRLQDTIASIPPLLFSMKKYLSPSFTVGLCAMATLLLLVMRSYATRKSRYSRPGSVSDLVRRGQLRSDRRVISTPLMYDDPFNNPMVKVAKSNSTVEMCGKVYRLAPVTLTKEQRAIHQKRRSRAYQWKRPKVFLREGDSVPPDVDPDTVRWIPANHPFATTASDIDEDLAQNNVYQKHGVPFRIRAEHEALQRKLEALQNEQKLDKLVIDPGAAKDFERPYKSHLKSDDSVDKNSWDSQMGSKHSSNSDSVHNSLLNRPASEEIQKP